MQKLLLKQVLFYGAILLILMIQVYPIVWIFLSSLKSKEQFLGANPFSLPDSFSLDSFVYVFEQTQFMTYFKNSLIVTVISIFFIIILSATAAFALEKMRFKFSNVLLIFFLCGIMIPIQVTLIPLFIIYKSFDLLNSYTSLVLPQVGFALPISIYLFVGFYKYIPNDLMEAAVMDGCGIFKVFRHVILPLSKNTVITVTAMNSIFIWNEFIFANTFISENALKTLTVGLQDFVGQYGLTDWSSTFAAISITTIPTLIVYFALNKSIISGMTAGATKG
ncbi:carbohydrate ABC transporter permease [Paenibacillus sp. Soil522]|uniref:carbohydrate ABC transporter permease n=1 Tax=Paenibacillus sp. Soil522 TaxID=1736388 RepID=UPI0007004C60|nr:carbohydrate ABC transporter permease [Paenibacillus sp. Soil522]KRE35253.1 sugar ABC transporter permease [Paenibacillus sp. Soil522]